MGVSRSLSGQKVSDHQFGHLFGSKTHQICRSTKHLPQSRYVRHAGSRKKKKKKKCCDGGRNCLIHGDNGIEAMTQRYTTAPTESNHKKDPWSILRPLQVGMQFWPKFSETIRSVWILIRESFQKPLDMVGLVIWILISRGKERCPVTPSPPLRWRKGARLAPFFQ